MWLHVVSRRLTAAFSVATTKRLILGRAGSVNTSINGMSCKELQSAVVKRMIFGGKMMLCRDSEMFHMLVAFF